jgi:hypothetical protein
MGFDIAYHALSKQDLEETIIPYLCGKVKSIDDFAEKIARVRRNRFITSQFASELYKIYEEKQTSFSPIIRSLNSTLSFDPELHIWGRPFLVLENKSDKMINVIQEYCGAISDKQVIDIVRDQVNLIGSKFFKDLNQEVVIGNGLPSHDILKQTYIEELEQTRAIFQCYINQTSYKSGNGEEYNPQSLISNPYYLLDSISMSYPAWMDRGLVCPSSLFKKINVALPDYARNSQILYESLDDTYKLEEIGIMEENYTLGIAIQPEDIQKFIHFYESYEKELKTILRQEEFSKKEIQRILQKTKECLYYCKITNNIFVESTDIFSGIYGNLT